MIVLLDTATPQCRLTVVDGDVPYEYIWQADRNLAHHLLKFLHEKLAENGADFTDVSGIGVMKGPGSFTGLRIGLTVMNTIASDHNIPIVGASGETWHKVVLDRLQNGETDQLVMPEYGAGANITVQRK